MNPIIFDQVSFAYTEPSSTVFENLSIELSAGVVSLVGQNGTGKSTFMLLASGRLLPTTGKVQLLAADTASLDDESKQRLCSLVYQNMEFETEEPLGQVMEFVYQNGFLPQKDGQLLTEVTRVLELQSVLMRKTQHLSKGELQRAVMAFSLLYGSQMVMMDEPVFALEDRQKHQALEYLTDYSQRSGVSFLYSVHELELSRRYSPQVLLFSKHRGPILGPTTQLLQREILEEAYQVPYSLLHQKEHLYRESLIRTPGDAAQS